MFSVTFSFCVPSSSGLASSFAACREREREANYSTKLGIKLPSCPYEETVPLEQGLGLIRRVMERKGCFLRAGVPHPFWIKRTEMYRAFNAAPLAITKKALEVP